MPPQLSEDTHPVARAWYDSLASSGQSDYYEPSDWAAAVYVAEAISRNLAARRFSHQAFATIFSAMADLLTTEAYAYPRGLSRTRHRSQYFVDATGLRQRGGSHHRLAQCPRG